jgi:drug/metabolite transporter (DMT)-like permease
MLLTQAFRHASPPLLAPFGYGQIVFAGLLGLLLFKHAPDQVGLLGIAIIVGSGLFMAYAQKR